MATTYYDYTIKYGDTTISTNTNTELTSIAVKLGSSTKATISSATTKTLLTSGKYCAENISIGAKTLSTSGKYCDKNISVTTTVKYKWQKFNTAISYSQATQSYTATQVGYGSGALLESQSSSYTGYFYYLATSYSFNSSTGKYTLSGGYAGGYSSTGGNLLAYGSGTGYGDGRPYCSGMYTSTITQPLNRMYMAGNTGEVCHYYAGSGSIRRLELIPFSKSSSVIGTASKYYSSTTYSKGSTSYGYVYSTSSSAYPTNGCNSSDGYWYVAA